MEKQLESISKTKKKINIFRICRHFTAIVIWFYIFSTLFFVNVDVLISSRIPNIYPYIQYKFIFILLLIAIAWLALGSKRFFFNILYISVYPFILVLFTLFKMLGFSTGSFIAVVGYIFWAIKSAKLWFVNITFYFASLSLIYLNINIYLTAASMIFLMVLLFYHYIHRIYTAFKPTTVISDINEFLIKNWKNYQEKNYTSEKLKNLERNISADASKDDKRKAFKKITSILIENSLYSFFLKKLREFQATRILAVSAMVKILTTLALTVICYGFLYYGINIIYPYSFSASDQSGIFYYLYTSFNTMITNSVENFIPITPLAKILVTTQQVCSILILVFLFFVFTTIVRERYQEELEALILTLDNMNTELLSILHESSNLTIEKIINMDNYNDDEYITEIQPVVKFRKVILRIDE